MKREKSLNKYQISKIKMQNDNAKLKMIALLLIIGLNWVGLSAIGEALAYFNDEEISSENILSAGTLDFRLTNQNVSGFVGMENNGEIFHTSVAIPESGSMPMQYFVYSTSASSTCSQFRVRVKQNETEIFNGLLPDFLSAATTVFGTWKFEFDLPVGASVTQEDLCQANITFSAWREEIENPEESGFFDIEILSLNLKAKTIVLNEVLAYPNPSYPYPANREFIELKNNGNAPVDVAGWKVSEMTGGGVENKYTITTAGGSYTASPYGGSTIIPAGGWLVLLLSDTTAFNNNGDTIRLYDASNNRLDEYTYTEAKYGLSDARYLDGIGAWVDPIPTPGAPNILYEETIPEVIEEESVIVEEVSVEPAGEETENICAAPSAAQEEEPALEEQIIEAEEPIVECLEIQSPNIEEYSTPEVVGAEEIPPAIEENPPMIEQAPAPEEPDPPPPLPDPEPSTTPDPTPDPNL
jgi:hypothetical protein